MSVCFARDDYVPKATFHPGFFPDGRAIEWADIVGAGAKGTRDGNMSWANNFEQYLEMDLFDTSGAPDFIQKCVSAGPSGEIWDSLVVMASISTFFVVISWSSYASALPTRTRIGNGAQAILRTDSLVTLLQKMMRGQMGIIRTVVLGLSHHGSFRFCL